MPLWASLYMVLVGLVGAAAAAYDVYSGASRTFVLADAVSTLGLLLMVLAYWHGPTAAWLGKTALPLVIVVLAWEVYATAKERPSAPSNSEREQWLWVVLMALFYAPAFAAGAAVGLRAW